MRETGSTPRPRNILIIQLRQLGDILLTTPLISEIKRLIPGSRVSMLTHPMGRLVLAGNPHLDQDIYYPADGGLRQNLALVHFLRSQQFDVILDGMNNPRSAFFTVGAGCLNQTMRVGFAGRRRFIYHRRCLLGGDPCYIVKEKFRLLEPLGIQGQCAELTLPWRQDDRTSLDHFAAAHPAFQSAPLRVVLSPTHRHEVRRWPLPMYAKLADWLAHKWGASVTWIWGPGEEGVIDEVMSLCRTETLKSPPTTLRELAAWIAHCDLFIGNSNGPSHLAVAVDTPSLQLHGPTNAISWCPMTTSHCAIQSPSSSGVIAEISLEAVQQQLSAMLPRVLSQSHWRRSHSPWCDWLTKRSLLHSQGMP